MADTTFKRLINQCISTSTVRENRTGIDTFSCFGSHEIIDISTNIAVITLKHVPIDKIIMELVWFLSGSTDVNKLRQLGCNIWNGNSSKEFLENRGLQWDAGIIGPGYGHQWRNSGGFYDGSGRSYNELLEDPGYTQFGVDQIRQCLHDIVYDPYSRRVIMSAWQASDISQMALPPCHVMFQFYVRNSSGFKYLDGHLYQRSADLFLGVPFNIASYSILLHLFAHLAGYKPGILYLSYGDLHIYKNHNEQIMKICPLETKKYPTIRFSDRIKPINPDNFDDTIRLIGDLKLDDFIVEGYESHPRVYGKMAI